MGQTGAHLDGIADVFHDDGRVLRSDVDFSPADDSAAFSAHRTGLISVGGQIDGIGQIAHQRAWRGAASVLRITVPELPARVVSPTADLAGLEARAGEIRAGGHLDGTACTAGRRDARLHPAVALLACVRLSSSVAAEELIEVEREGASVREGQKHDREEQGAHRNTPCDEHDALR